MSNGSIAGIVVAIVSALAIGLLARILYMRYQSSKDLSIPVGVHDDDDGGLSGSDSNRTGGVDSVRFEFTDIHKRSNMSQYRANEIY